MAHVNQVLSVRTHLANDNQQLDETPLLHRQHQIYSTIGDFRHHSFINHPAPLFISEADVMLILTHHRFFNTFHSKIRGPTAYNRFLSSTEDHHPRNFDDVIYDHRPHHRTKDRKRKIMLQPNQQHRPGPFFLMDSKKRSNANLNLSRTIYTMKIHNVRYRLIDYLPIELPELPEDGPVAEEVAEALEDEDAGGHPVEDNMLEHAQVFDNDD
ncbi:hypothetical protein MKW94_020751 [Papaver nudicaule]|uniref:Uncharacterized protein n=1 Tax=Papaver nudicaule TaxID=74823 RepID=A0AA41V2Z3_PAPNU|nr:hypothetical protein [Papaver nudicaule]